MDANFLESIGPNFWETIFPVTLHSRGDHIEFGSYPLVPLFLRSVVIKFCNIIVNLRATFVEFNIVTMRIRYSIIGVWFQNYTFEVYVKVFHDLQHQTRFSDQGEQLSYKGLGPC